MRKYFTIILILFSIISYCENFKKLVDKTYNFSPHELNSQEIDAKSIELDKFWNIVQSDTGKYLPLLRNELLADGHSPFFYFDASSLLLNSSKSKANYEITFQATSKVDLQDIEGSDFLHRVNLFASMGFNTNKFAEMILNAKTFTAFFVQHALTLDKDYSLLFVLLPIPIDLYLEDLIKRLDNEKDLTNQKAIITVLAYSCNCIADRAIESYATKIETDNTIKDLVKNFTILSHKKQDNTEFKKLLDKRNHEILTRLSDEALDELNDITQKIKENYICR